MSVPSGRTVFVAQPDDTVNIIDLLLVRMEPKPAADGPGGGQGISSPMIRRSQAASERELPRSIKHHQHRWVAYHGDRRAAIVSPSETLSSSAITRICLPGCSSCGSSNWKVSGPTETSPARSRHPPHIGPACGPGAVHRPQYRPWCNPDEEATDADHDRSRVLAGTFHDFHQGWTIEIRNRLNSGVLPDGYDAMADQRVSGRCRTSSCPGPRGPEPTGGLVVAETPPRIQRAARVETETALYARKANRIAIHHELGRVVAMIEVVSPGNKDTKHAIASFIAKAVDFIRNGIHFLAIDLFPPGPRDPHGLAQAIWDELVGEPLGTRPADKLLTVAAYDAGDELTAYVDGLAVGDLLPDAPLFPRRAGTSTSRSNRLTWLRGT